MRTSILYSVLLHAVIIVVSIYGLPAIRKPPVIQDIPIIVEVVEIAAKTNLPAKPEPKPEEKKPEVKPAAAAEGGKSTAPTRARTRAGTGSRGRRAAPAAQTEA